jgi:predicted nucleic acid-binding Zn ribbon protein
MITAKPLRMCPNCGKKRLKRLIGTGAGIIFKGSGFYQTDYRSESYKKAEKNEKSSAEKKPAAESKEAKADEKSKMGSSKKKSA